MKKRHLILILSFGLFLFSKISYAQTPIPLTNDALINVIRQQTQG